VVSDRPMVSHMVASANFILRRLLIELQSLSLLVGGRSGKEMRDRIRRVRSSDSFVGFGQQ